MHVRLTGDSKLTMGVSVFVCVCVCMCVCVVVCGFHALSLRTAEMVEADPHDPEWEEAGIENG